MEARRVERLEAFSMMALGKRSVGAMSGGVVVASKLENVRD